MNQYSRYINQQSKQKAVKAETVINELKPANPQVRVRNFTRGVFKISEITMTVSTNMIRPERTNAFFSSADRDTAKQIFRLIKNNGPVRLDGECDLIIIHDFPDLIGAGSITEVYPIASPETGVIETIIPERILGVGTTRMVQYIYVLFKDGRKIDVGVVESNINRARIDSEMIVWEGIYNQRFEELAAILEAEFRERMEIIGIPDAVPSWVNEHVNNTDIHISSEEINARISNAIANVELLEGPEGPIGATGESGITPHISKYNGNWWIGDTDTGVKARGPVGEDGKDGLPGKDGRDGENGRNASEIDEEGNVIIPFNESFSIKNEDETGLSITDLSEVDYSQFHFGKEYGPNINFRKDYMMGNAEIKVDDSNRLYFEEQSNDYGGSNQMILSSNSNSLKMSSYEDYQANKYNYDTSIKNGYEQEIHMINNVDENKISFKSNEVELYGDLTVQGEINNSTIDNFKNQFEDIDTKFNELKNDIHRISLDQTISDSSWTTINESQEGVFTNKSIEGRTLVNLWSDNPNDFLNLFSNITLDGFDIRINATSTEWQQCTMLGDIFKPNTVYTIITDIVEMDAGLNFRTSAVVASENDIFIGASMIHTQVGRSIVTATTHEDITNRSLRTMFQNQSGASGLQAHVRLSIYEGDLTNLTLNHTLPREFTSPRNLVITSMGENLFDGELEWGSFNSNTGLPESHTMIARSVNYIPVQGGRAIAIQTNRPGDGRQSRIISYDKDLNILQNVLQEYPLILSDNARYIRFQTRNVAGSAIDLQTLLASVSYDRQIPADTPHTSQSQQLQYQNEQGEWVNVPELQGIQVGGNLLVSDEITDNEYIQRVVETNLATGGSGVNGVTVLPEDLIQVWFNLGPVNGNAMGFAGNVLSNKLPTTSRAQTNTGLGIALNHNTSDALILTVPRTFGQSAAQVRQHLIDNDYKFLVPLAQPRRYPIRSWDLPSHEPVTNIHVSSGQVSPRFSFKISTAILPRLRKVENRLTNLENDFRDHIQTLARAIVQPLEKRDYRSVAELGWPCDFKCELVTDGEEVE